MEFTFHQVILIQQYLFTCYIIVTKEYLTYSLLGPNSQAKFLTQHQPYLLFLQQPLVLGLILKDIWRHLNSFDNFDHLFKFLYVFRYILFQSSIILTFYGKIIQIPLTLSFLLFFFSIFQILKLMIYFLISL
ncbi:unnamed protein product (macronuclear) [Paramecium tetraurelia]|uniref:Transmembrane protein n=1 Tax=Paramecium tetraurelia TaxID=5888 RepID=A0ECN5_PARTE|nr:uncharacterized protein GSPATT00003921001 [Paramecium tetraurelia]CAK93052.1 unnamed protein product [Paramecium tetraurelia]|eukprot:XP_001460449.1 hypothetical protein (macronuclear) [Paramecium tetraurelia strain d4-2]